MTIKVLLAYTKQVEKGYEHAPSRLEYHIERDVNRLYRFAGLPVKVDIFREGPVAYTESSRISADLSNLQRASTPGLDRVHTVAEREDADLVIMMVAENTNNNRGSPADDNSECARASATLAKGASTSFGVVLLPCLLAEYGTFVIGMLQGAGPPDVTNREFTYGRGYQDKKAGQRTAMAPGDVD